MKRTVLALALGASLLAAACGGGGAPGTTNETQAPGVSAGPNATPRSAPGYKDESPMPGSSGAAPSGSPKGGYDY